MFAELMLLPARLMLIALGACLPESGVIKSARRTTVPYRLAPPAHMPASLKRSPARDAKGRFVR